MQERVNREGNLRFFMALSIVVHLFLLAAIARVLLKTPSPQPEYYVFYQADTFPSIKREAVTWQREQKLRRSDSDKASSQPVQTVVSSVEKVPILDTGLPDQTSGKGIYKISSVPPLGREPTVPGASVSQVSQGLYERSPWEVMDVKAFSEDVSPQQLPLTMTEVAIPSAERHCESTVSDQKPRDIGRKQSFAPSGDKNDFTGPAPALPLVEPGISSKRADAHEAQLPFSGIGNGYSKGVGVVRTSSEGDVAVKSGVVLSKLALERQQSQTEEPLIPFRQLPLSAPKQFWVDDGDEAVRHLSVLRSSDVGLGDLQVDGVGDFLPPSELPVMSANLPAGTNTSPNLLRSLASMPAAPVVDDSPVILQHVAPIYPVAARRRGLEGMVVLLVRPGRDGYPVEIRVEQSSGRLDFDLSAQEAVEKWKFKSTSDSARWVRIKVEFQLN